MTRLRFPLWQAEPPSEINSLSYLIKTNMIYFINYKNFSESVIITIHTGIVYFL